MITVDGVTKTYGAHRAVDDVSFVARPGRVTGFLGPNGAGKSTTMRIMVGLTPASSGRVTIGGHSYGDIPNPGRLVGVLLDASAQHEGRTGREILTIGAETMGLPAVARRRDARAGLPDAGRGGAPAQELLPRDAPAPRHRPRAARRPAHADPRRAGQRPRPGGDPLDARAAPGVRRRRAAPCSSPPTCCTRSRRSPTTWSSSVGAGSSPRAPSRSCSRPAAPTSGPSSRRPSPRHCTGTASTRSPREPGCAATSSPARSATWPPREGLALEELRPAEGAGLEDLFLQLTADTQREGTAA